MRKTPIIASNRRFARRTFLLAGTAVLLAACDTFPKRTPGKGKPTTQAPAFIRPASGFTLARFDGNRNKGIDIAGKAGDPVMAAADGRVVYVGSDLRGYGKMVIVKHNDTYLTAYAHNRAILVREKEVVRQGQVIAEMGDTAADRVKLHFELRKDGNAVDPEPYFQGKLR